MSSRQATKNLSRSYSTKSIMPPLLPKYFSLRSSSVVAVPCPYFYCRKISPDLSATPSWPPLNKILVLLHALICGTAK